MVMKKMQETALDHIQDGQVHETALQQFCNSFSIHAVTVKYCLDLSVPQLTFEVYVAGIRVGGGTINRDNPSITIGGSAAGVKAQVKLTADFDKKQATYDLTLCVPIFGCTSYSGVMFSW